jgi:hypothetical protein
VVHPLQRKSKQQNGNKYGWEIETAEVRPNGAFYESLDLTDGNKEVTDQVRQVLNSFMAESGLEPR